MSAAAPSPTADTHPASERVLTVRNLRAFYQTHHFGVRREVRAVDDVSLHVDRDEIYGLAGESSCGKTTLIKTIARATRPPLNVVGGAVNFHFAGRDRDILQDVIAALRNQDFGIDMQFTNYRSN